MFFYWRLPLCHNITSQHHIATSHRNITHTLSQPSSSSSSITSFIWATFKLFSLFKDHHLIFESVPVKSSCNLKFTVWMMDKKILTFHYKNTRQSTMNPLSFTQSVSHQPPSFGASVTAKLPMINFNHLSIILIIEIGSNFKILQ